MRLAHLRRSRVKSSTAKTAKTNIGIEKSVASRKATEEMTGGIGIPNERNAIETETELKTTAVVKTEMVLKVAVAEEETRMVLVEATGTENVMVTLAGSADAN